MQAGPLVLPLGDLTPQGADGVNAALLAVAWAMLISVVPMAYGILRKRPSVGCILSVVALLGGLVVVWWTLALIADVFPASNDPNRGVPVTWKFVPEIVSSLFIAAIVWLQRRAHWTWK